MKNAMPWVALAAVLFLAPAPAGAQQKKEEPKQQAAPTADTKKDASKADAKADDSKKDAAKDDGAKKKVKKGGCG